MVFMASPSHPCGKIFVASRAPWIFCIWRRQSSTKRAWHPDCSKAGAARRLGEGAREIWRGGTRGPQLKKGARGREARARESCVGKSRACACGSAPILATARLSVAGLDSEQEREREREGKREGGRTPVRGILTGGALLRAFDLAVAALLVLCSIDAQSASHGDRFLFLCSALVLDWCSALLLVSLLNWCSALLKCC